MPSVPVSCGESNNKVVYTFAVFARELGAEIHQVKLCLGIGTIKLE